MLNKIKLFLVKKYLLGYIVKAYSSIKGYKTQVAIGLAVLVWVAARFQYLTPDQEQSLYEMLGGAGTITLLQKLQRWQSDADELGKLVNESSGK